MKGRLLLRKENDEQDTLNAFRRKSYSVNDVKK